MRLELEGLIEFVENAHAISETDEEIISGLTFAKGEGVGGCSNKSKSKVESIFMRLSFERQGIKNDDTLERVRQLRSRIAYVEQEVQLVETLLSGLDARQRFIIEQFYCERQRVEYIQQVYPRRFNIDTPMSKSTIMSIKKAALDVMVWMLDATESSAME